MDLNLLQVRRTNSSLNKADLITIANNQILVPGAGAGSHVLAVETEATGTTLSGTGVGGDNESQIQVTPHYFPKAVAGQMAVAYVDDLDWANNNLTKYEYLKFENSSAANAAVYLVNGVMSVTADEAYDPFDTASGKGGENIVGAFACYAPLGGQMFD